MSRLLRKLVFCSKTDTVPSTRPADSGEPTTECAVCQDPPTKPCTLPCGNKHVFCLACLQGIVTHNHHHSHFPCPLCRQQVRIPMGGVRAFRQGKGGGGRRLLTHLPGVALPGRCGRRRRRRNSDDSSSSSGWPEGESDGRGWFPALDLDDDDDMDDDDDSSYVGLPRGVSASSSDDVLDPEQIVILQSLRGLDQAMILQRVRDRAGEDLPVTVQDGDEGASGGGGGGGGGERRSSFGLAESSSSDDRDSGDFDVSEIPVLISDSTEDLDITFVLQLIADMEKNDREVRITSQASSSAKVQHGEDAEQVQAEKKAESPPCRGSPEPAQEATLAGGSSSDSTEDQNIRDWKLRTIADTSIPRPKLTFARDTGEGRSVRLQEEDEKEEIREDLGGLEHLPHQLTSLSGSWEEAAESPPLPAESVLSLKTGALDNPEEELQMDYRGTHHESTENSSSLESESADRDVHQKPRMKSGRLSPGSALLTGRVKNQTQPPSPEKSHDQPPPRYGTTNSDEEKNSRQTVSENGSSAADHDHNNRDPQHHHHHRPEHTTTTTTATAINGAGGSPPPEDLSPEGWRRQELQKLQQAKQRMDPKKPAAAAGAAAAGAGAGDEETFDVHVSGAAERAVISEGPGEWVRRIRSLQHRRSPGKGSVVTVTRSHSNGGGGGKAAFTETDGGRSAGEGIDGRGVDRVGTGREEKG